MTPSPGSAVLVLVPTAVEARRLEDHGGFEPGLAVVALCGFGPVAAAARTAALLASVRPARVLLLGIAGTFDAERLPIGGALAFDAVAIEGIGAGEGASLAGPAALGFPQWPGGEGAGAIHDRIVLAPAGTAEVRGAADVRSLHERATLLLSTCAASASPEQAAVRRARFPDALAEDMEGFAVAFACALAGVPCHVVRGISNVVGDRNPARWRIPAAIGAARLCALEILKRPVVSA